MAAWIKMILGVEVGLGPGDFVLDGDPAPPQKGGGAPSPIFGPCLLWPNSWRYQDATWYGNGKWIGSAIFAQLTAQSAYTLQWAPLSTRSALCHGRPGPPMGRRMHKFNRICQVAPMCPHGRTRCWHLSNNIESSVYCGDVPYGKLL